MATTLILNGAQAAVVSNLDTYNYTAKSSATHFVTVSVTEHPASSLSIVIQKNGTPVATSTPPSATQAVINLSTPISCSASDVLSVVLSSSAAIDQRINHIKGIINIHVGSSN